MDGCGAVSKKRDWVWRQISLSTAYTTRYTDERAFSPSSSNIGIYNPPSDAKNSRSDTLRRDHQRRTRLDCHRQNMSSENASASSLNDKDTKNIRGEKVEAGTYDAQNGTVRAGLEEVDQGLENRPPWLLTRTEVKPLDL